MQETNLEAEQELKYRQLVENAGQAIYVIQDRIFKFANPKAEEISGYTSDELTGMPFLELLHPDDSSRIVEQHILRLQGGAVPALASCRIIHKSGETRWVEFNATIIQWAGQPATLNFLSDITRRKQMEDAMRASEEKFRSIAEQSSDMIGFTDSQGFILYVSPACKDLFGARPEEMTGRRFMEFLDELSIPTAMAAFQDSIEQAHQYKNLELKMKRLDGSRFIGELNGGAAQVGEQRGTVVVIRDITERKQAQEALVKSESKFRMIFETAGIGISIADLSGHFLNCNPSIQKILGYTPDEYCRLSVSEISHPEDVTIDLSLYQELLDGKRESYSIEKHNIHKDGHIVWGQLVCTVVRDTNNQPLFTIGMFEDISERKQAEEKLNQKMEDLERFNRLTVDRELRMVELKIEINTLLKQAGKLEKYRIVQ
jgi:two-component system cell cycle sensor histidine kinase/response regulator CckA